VSTPEPRGRWPKSQRIRSRRHYQSVQTGAERVVLPRFVLLLQAQPAGNPISARLGITASRKIGGAVVRNRAKRLVREAFRATRGLWPDGLDLVVIVRRLDAGMRLQDVVDEWTSARARIASTLRRVPVTPDSARAERSAVIQTGAPRESTHRTDARGRRQ
jgi:ribonuclease P protein component